MYFMGVCQSAIADICFLDNPGFVPTTHNTSGTDSGSTVVSYIVTPSDRLRSGIHLFSRDWGVWFR